MIFVTYWLISLLRRKSDIENERLPPELFDLESDEGRAIMNSGSLPTTPSEDPDNSSPVNPYVVDETLKKVIDKGITSPSSINTGVSSTPASPSSPASPGPTVRRGHSRQASLGTTMTSPSTRRRSIESTMSLIQGVWDGKTVEEEKEKEDAVNDLANKVADKTSIA